MIPTDFHKTAELLKDKHKECHIRTSITRSYYGVFLHLRDFLAQGDIKKREPTRSIHTFVQVCFLESRVTEGETIGANLSHLRRAREDADYELGQRIERDRSQDCFKTAKRTIAQLEKLIACNAQARKKILKNARIAAQKRKWL